MLQLRKITEKDVRLLFLWANEEEVRNNAINTHKIDWEDHINWFNKKLQSHDSYMFIGFLQDEPIGQIRFDRENDDYVVDYSIEKNYRGRGLGTDIVKEGIKVLREIIHEPFTVIAIVKEGNIASSKVFTRLRFAKTSTVSESGQALNYYKLIVT